MMAIIAFSIARFILKKDTAVILLMENIPTFFSEFFVIVAV